MRQHAEPPSPVENRSAVMRHLDRLVRRVLPRSLLGRMLLIGFIPLLVTQGISLELFYGNYLKIVSRRLSAGVVNNIAMTIDIMERYPAPSDRAWILRDVRDRAQLHMTWREGESLQRVGSNHVLGPVDDDLVRDLRVAIGRPAFVDWKSDRHIVSVFIQMPDGVLRVDTPRKRLDVAPVWLFVAWATGSALLLFCIAAFFMRNQVRAIRRLARAAELFGLGRDIDPIHPEGAQEIRKAAVAFNRMRDRIFRFVEQRTSVLAGVSHDLRTPLTRLRLTLAMVPRQGTIRAADLQPDIEDMVADVGEMERMIESYLSFARGEGAEVPAMVDVRELLEEVATAARRAGARDVSVLVTRASYIVVRPAAFRRVLSNIVDNARRHASHIRLSARKKRSSTVIYVDDDGCGIDESRRESVFRPFESGRDGGTGLGLAIARDIIHAHGGEIRLDSSPSGGLRVRIVIPD
ncbi:HAMP domain-containing protein [Gluconacetobacter entanii]|nr:HAMP domain-containing protein [Komagataeibacter sp. FXV2]MBY4638601.1 HAMP domain-containing protein [Gluconacetobacter entanii]NPC87822.1 HAMP domain-containing protein [Gluconacetobacter entanii]